MQVAREQAQQQRNSAAAARREQGRQLAEAREEAAALSAEVFQLQEALRLRDSALRRLKQRLEGAGLPGSVRPSEVCSLALHVKQQPAGSPGTVRHSSSTAGLACCWHIPLPEQVAAVLAALPGSIRPGRIVQPGRVLAAPVAATAGLASRVRLSVGSWVAW